MLFVLCHTLLGHISCRHTLFTHFASGLKSRGTDSEGERGALGSEAKEEENGEEVFPPHRTLGSRRAS